MGKNRGRNISQNTDVPCDKVTSWEQKLFSVPAIPDIPDWCLCWTSGPGGESAL